MDASEQARFDALYAQHLRALKLQGKATKTTDSYARAIRRVSAYFDRCPDQLDGEDFKTYFASLIDTRSWTLVKIERCGCSSSTSTYWAGTGRGLRCSSPRKSNRCRMC